ncbi:extracellular solute-binding protein [Brachybacterium sp. EF45031]|uniref:sugar ABC transporter substrate-binding protein n=1 Tax=Brachybacterium sillae TaxID=2810536 RepID=UPI00217E0213|nr:extracellular solute-binding protein [Brachybacterium sillae]MCS6711525.1 extracellular solute-binding protein [Brachybacterium sillae]
MIPTPRITRRALTAGAVPILGLTLAACGGSGFEDADSDSGGTGSGGSDAGSGSGGALSVLIGSSGDAETKAVKDAVAAWSQQSGTAAEVIVASDLNQQLSQGFASGKPADVFYLSTDALAGFAGNGSIEAYGDDLANKADFFPKLVEAFTLDGTFYAAPKDFSTLALIINSDLWSAAGLTDADIPTDWDGLHAAATKLTQGDVVGLSMGAEYQRLGAFMAQAGGELVTDGRATADSPQNIEALTFVKSMMADGSLKFAKDLGAGWGGEAFGKGLAAMVIEGNWITGALSNDFPDVKYRVVELPAGPGGKGTLQFSNAWGLAAGSTNKDQARSLIEHLTSPEQQMAFAKAFGVMPSVQSTAEDWSAEYPDLAPFMAGAGYAKNPPAQAGTSDVIADLNSQLETLGSSDPKTILNSVQTNLQAALGG